VTLLVRQVPQGRNAPVDIFLEPAVEQALVLIRRAESLGLALAGFEVIDLPPATIVSADKGHISAIASLYLAAELEVAMLVPAAEVLAGLAVSGGLPFDFGEANEVVGSFWRTRHERFTPAERSAFYARLFGMQPDASSPSPSDGLVNREFEGLFINLCEALFKLDEQAVSEVYGGPRQQVRVRTTASLLLENLLQHSGGLTAFAARDILGTVQAALALLKQPRIQQAFTSRSVWDLLRTLATRYLHCSPEIESHIMRGKAGMTILSWLADTITSLGDDSQPLLRTDHPVIQAAVDWLQISLSLSEKTATAAAAGG
jgi:hypothetical protein